MAYMNVKLDKHWSRPAALVACVAAGLLLAGCAPAYGPRGGGYYGGQSQPGYAGAGQCYQGCGVVRDMREVRLNGGSSDGAVLGTVIGAAVGGLLGSKLGRGNGKTATTIAGVVGGGVAGHAIGKHASGSDYGWQIVVQLNDGRYATVTERGAPQVRVGDLVMIRGNRVYRY